MSKKKLSLQNTAGCQTLSMGVHFFFGQCLGLFAATKSSPTVNFGARGLTNSVMLACIVMTIDTMQGTFPICLGQMQRWAGMVLARDCRGAIQPKSVGKKSGGKPSERDFKREAFSLDKSPSLQLSLFFFKKAVWWFRFFFFEVCLNFAHFHRCH